MRALCAGLCGVALAGCGLGFTSGAEETGDGAGASGATPLAGAGGEGGILSRGGGGEGGLAGSGGSGGSGGALPPCPTVDGASHFSDDFENGNLAPEWTVFGQNSQMLVGETGGHGVITLPSDGAYALTAQSTASYSLVGCQVAIEVVSVPELSFPVWAWLAVWAQGDRWASITLQQPGEIRFKAEEAGVTIGEITLPFVAAAHRWWRIMEQGGDVQLQVSPDGQTWITPLTFPAPSWLRSIVVEWGTDTATTEAGGTTFAIDNLNRLP